jgi:branched-chain amino acid aminotransferase
MSDAATPRVAYINGRFLPEKDVMVPFRDLSFLRGYGAYDMTRTFHGRPDKLAEHVKRLYRSLRYIGIDLGMGQADVVRLSEDTLERNRHLLTPDTDFWICQRVSAGTQAVGDEGWEHIGPSLIIECRPLPFQKHARLFRDGVKIITSVVPRTSARSLSPRVKMHNYLNIVLAVNDVHRIDPSARAMMLDENGYLAEGEGSNIFLVVDGVIQTPRTRNVLPGISRATVIDIARSLGLEVQEIDLDLFDATIADEMFITSTSLCICPVASFNGRKTGEGVPGPLTRRLTAKYIELVGCDFVAQYLKWSDAAAA